MQELSKVIELIRKLRGVRIEPYRLPVDDRNTFELLSRSETIGVPGLNASGMRDFLRTTKPENFDDLVAIHALYRPRPMEAGLMRRFNDATEGRSDTATEHPRLKPFLADSRGVLIYREQIIRVLHEIFGLEQQEAEEFVALASRHDPEDVKAYRTPFIEGALQNGVDLAEAESLFELTVAFCPHAITKAEFMPTARKTYAAAYLKARYPLEFMAGMLSTYLPRGRAKSGLSARSIARSLRTQGFEVRDPPSGLDDPVVQLVEECHRMGIKVLGPDVNKSEAGFTIEGDSIRCGFLAVKDVDTTDSKAIVGARRTGGSFKSFNDFVKRANPTIKPKLMDVLVKAGAFDSLGANRTEALTELARVPSGGSDLAFSTFAQKQYEKEVLGFYVSGHPVGDIAGIEHRKWSHTTAEAGADRHGEPVSIAGLPVHVRLVELGRTSANGRSVTYAAFNLEDGGGRIACVAWPEKYATYSKLLDGKTLVLAEGRLQKYSGNDRATLIVDAIRELPVSSDSNNLSQ